MDITQEYRKEISLITSYYANILDKDNNLVLIGLNDDRGFSFQKNILSYLKNVLQSDKYNMTVFDAYSMFFNKTRHIDYYLKNNISLYEIELMKKYGTINEICHAVGNNFLVENIAKLISNHLPNPSSPNKNIRLSDTIKNSKEPIIIYSSGINDIMYHLCINPYNVKRCYYEDKEKYEYAKLKASGWKKEETLKTIIKGHEENFDKLLGINNSSKICSLGAYLYSDNTEYNKIFQEFVLSYNEKLEELCKKYNINYIDIRLLENTPYQNILFTYFHHTASIIAGEILKILASNLDKSTLEVPKFIYTDDGSIGVLKDMVNYENDTLSNESLNFYLDKREELSREEDVFSKVILEKRKTIKR